MDKKLAHLGERKVVKSVIEDFNLQNLIKIIKSSLIWCLLFLMLSISASLFYLKHTQPKYSSSTTLMFATQKQTQILGVEDLLAKDNIEIDKEIELIKSELILSRSLDSADLSVEYFTKGKIGKTEYYKNSPFKVVFNNYMNEVVDQELTIVFKDKRNYTISFELNSETILLNGTVDKDLKSKYFNLKVELLSKSFDFEKFTFVIYLRDFKSNVAKISKRLVVSPLNKNSNTLNISFEDTHPLRAKEIVEAIASYFIKFDAIKKAESIDQTITFLEEQIIDFGNEYAFVQDSMKQFRIESGFIDPSIQITRDISKIEELESTLLNVEVSSNSLNWLAEYLKNDNELSNLTGLVLSEESANFQNSIGEISTLQSKRNQKLLNVTPDHPDILLINREIETVKSNLLSQVELAKSREREKKADIKTEIDLIYKELYLMPDKETEFLKVKRENDLRQQFYFDLVEKKNLYLISKAGILSDYIVLKPATFSNKSIAPNVSMIKMFGVVVGLFLGLILITIRFLLYRKITEIKEIEENTNSKFIGAIPTYKEVLDESRIITINNPKSVISESFRAVRSNLEFINAEDKPKVITTTSTVPGEGKTFIGVNLAAIFSLLDKKVVVLDFDLRKPRIANVFSIDSQKGISTILIGKSTIKECIYSSGIKNLDVITAGPIPPNPSELIASKATKVLIEELKKDYDFIFIDTPPVGLVTDALDLLKQADYPIYVVRSEYSEREYLENVNKLIFDSGIVNLTTVLNDYGKGKSGYYGAYGYGYDGGYYSDEESQNVSFFKRIINKIFK